MAEARLTLTTTPQRVDSAPDDSVAFRHVTVVAQAAGEIVKGGADGFDPTTEGCRYTLAAGQAVSWNNIQGNEQVWLAVAADTLDVDTDQTGVA